MTSSLHWKPLIKDSQRIGDMRLKDILDKKFGYPWILDATDIPYLEGLYDAGTTDAIELINAINIHGKITISLES